jgi:hypothetical protein
VKETGPISGFGIIRLDIPSIQSTPPMILYQGDQLSKTHIDEGFMLTAARLLGFFYHNFFEHWVQLCPLEVGQ